MIRRALVACVAALSMFATSVPAGAAPRARPGNAARAQAKAHHARAEKLYALGRFDEALVAYQAAYEAEALPGFLLNIAQCYRNLDRLDEAVFTFRKYLQLRPDARDREDVEALIATLEAERARRADAAAEAARRDAEVKARADRALRPASPTPSPRATPVYRRWWFITGGVVLAGAAVGATVMATRDGLPDSDLGPVDFTK